ncbi:MAG: hypothetical protein O3C34_18335 [Proteobacteria bacterium]|nr:hypothetical protein [Pseudomonadota bacterium]
MRENADLDIRRPAHIWNATPLDRLATGQPTEILAGHTPESVIVRRSLVTLTTSRTSFDVWAALAYLEGLLSDYRRIAPRYSFMQTAGQASIAAENEYRLTLSDPALLEPVNTALGTMAANQAGLSRIRQRVMDVRVVRAGPWGGETGELVVEALQNHALAGASSLWVLAHDDSDDGNMRVTLDGLEIARWAWAPDLLASQQGSGNGSGVRIVDWDYLFERFAQALDGLPEATKPGASFSMIENANVIAQDDRIKEALGIHSGLKPFFDQAISI